MVVRPVAQRFGEWASASRTSSATTDLLAVFQREVARLLVLIFWVSQFMFHLHLPACWYFVDCSYLLADKASPPEDDYFVEMALLVALRYGSEPASAPDCFCDGTGTLYRLFSVA